MDQIQPVRTLRELQAHATNLTRHIYSKLPWGYRIAEAMTVLASDLLDTFGRVTYAEFIRAVVRGMPDVGGKPASDWILTVQSQKGADRLPWGTGREFAAKTFKILISKFGRTDLAEEAMSMVVSNSVQGKLHIKNGVSLGEAQSYVTTACSNAVKDMLRKEFRRKETPIERDQDDDSSGSIDLTDPTSFWRFEISQRDIDNIIDELKGVHGRAPNAFELLLQGETQREIAEDWGVSPSYVHKWLDDYGPKMRKVVQEHMRTASARLASNNRWQMRSDNPA